MIMKAVQIYYQCKGTPTIVHTDVEEIPSEERTLLASREFRCRHCGERWTESLTSPIILPRGVESSLEEYYKNINYCQQGK